MALQATVAAIAGLLLMSFARAQDSSAETKALDSTATQWSFQLAYQTMPDYLRTSTRCHSRSRMALASSRWVSEV